MIICDLCLQLEASGRCGLGLRLPKTMRCHDFQPGIEKFCAKPSDFAGQAQITQMATYFGVKGQELKKIMLIASKEDALRANHNSVLEDNQFSKASPS
ncbi:MAG TPA: hypothetical protein VFC63_05090 [Blastocatellia bacterium]|nr:hypothetical protein [Blastocatellia bacterium]